MDDLLPCPFCNCLHAPGILTVNIGHSGGYHHVVCNTNYAGCGAQGAVASTKELAAVAWNRRAANAPADPALLALARLGAWALDHDDIYDSDRRAAGALMMDGCAPGDVSALAARLLAPDGAASEGVTG